MEIQKRGHGKKKPGGTCLQKHGDRIIGPLEGTFPRPPLAELDGGARSSPGTPRAAVRGGRGVVARPRAVEWRRCRAGHTKTEIVLKIQNDMMVTTNKDKDKIL